MVGLNRRLSIVLHLLIALAMVPGILSLRTDNSPSVFFPRDAKALAEYELFRQHFGGGRVVRVTLGGEELRTAEGLDWLDNLERRSASLPGVAATLGPAGLHRWLLMQWPPKAVETFAENLVNDSNGLLKGLAGKDGRTMTLLLVLEEMQASEVRRLMEKLHLLLSQAPPGVETGLSGLPVLERAMDDELRRMATVILPLLLPLAMFFLALTFRRLADVLAPLIFVGVCLTLLFGMMGYAGVRLNLISFVITPLLFVIALATAIHILVLYRRTCDQNKNLSPAEAMRETYRNKTRPVIWTGLTTCVAFGSLMISPLPPLRSVGMWSALGMVLMTVLAFTFYPALLTLTGRSGKKSLDGIRIYGSLERRAGSLGRRLASRAVKGRMGVVVAMVITFLLAVAGIARLEVEDNIGRYFPPQHRVSKELKRLQESGIGVFSADLLISDRKGKGFQNPDSQQRLASLSARLRNLEPVYGAVSSGDLVEGVLRSFKTAETRGPVSKNSRWMALGLMQSIPESRRLLYTLLTEDGTHARITLLLPVLSFDKTEKVFAGVMEIAEEVFPEASIHITGRYPLLMSAQRKLMGGLIAALSLTLCCIFVVFLLILRRPGLTLRVLVPNLWPVAMVMGGMGWLGIPLDSASVMTASVVLGLAVDDTFHTLGQYLHLVRDRSQGEAIEITLERTAPAHILTTVILATGFAVCAAGDLLPIVRMGSLSAVAIGLALLGDLILIPAMLASKRVIT